MLEHRLQQHFFDNADLVYACAQELSKPIGDATSALLASITSGGKVLSLGEAEGSLLAQKLCFALLGRFERERPSLSAIALSIDSTHFGLRQLEALGQPGDVLLAWVTQEMSSHWLGALACARAKEMTTVVISGPNAVAKNVLTPTDVHIVIPHERKARVFEVQCLILHSLCDALDNQLLGEDHP